MLSYLAACVRPKGEIRSFEDWVANAFGRRLYETFFRSYTEKVWGIPCSEISADWAAQRIKDLSMRVLIRSALGLGSRNGPVIKTLIDRFRYPLHGRGEMWEELARTVQSRGAALKISWKRRAGTGLADGPAPHRTRARAERARPLTEIGPQVILRDRRAPLRYSGGEASEINSSDRRRAVSGLITVYPSNLSLLSLGYPRAIEISKRESSLNTKTVGESGHNRTRLAESSTSSRHTFGRAQITKGSTYDLPAMASRPLRIAPCRTIHLEYEPYSQPHCWSKRNPL